MVAVIDRLLASSKRAGRKNEKYRMCGRWRKDAVIAGIIVFLQSHMGSLRLMQADVWEATLKHWQVPMLSSLAGGGDASVEKRERNG